MLQCNNYNRARIVLAAVVLALTLGSASVVRAEAPGWRGTDAATGQLASVEDLTRLAADFPDSASVRLRLLNALLNAGNEEAAGKEALELAVRRYAFSAGAQPVIVNVLDPDYAAWFEAATARNRTPLEKSTLLATVPADALLVESVARDPKTGDLYATTIVSRALFMKRGAADWQRLDLDGAGSLSGMAYDSKAKLLWVASGNFEQIPGDKVYAALLGFDPATGQVVRRLYANGMVALGDVAVGDDGTVYVADPIEGVIHYARPGDDGLRALVGAGVFRSPQGMVAVPGGKLLIVSDYRYGLAAVDTQSGKVSRFASARPAMLDGIDGLWRNGRNLVAVQNGTSPMRIVRLEMSGDWLTVQQVTVLEQAHSARTEPVGGAVWYGELVYVATGQWDRFGEGGALDEGNAPGPTGIRVLAVGK